MTELEKPADPLRLRLSRQRTELRRLNKAIATWHRVADVNLYRAIAAEERLHSSTRPREFAMKQEEAPMTRFEAILCPAVAGALIGTVLGSAAALWIGQPVVFLASIGVASGALSGALGGWWVNS